MDAIPPSPPPWWLQLWWTSPRGWHATPLIAWYGLFGDFLVLGLALVVVLGLWWRYRRGGAIAPAEVPAGAHARLAEDLCGPMIWLPR